MRNKDKSVHKFSLHDSIITIGRKECDVTIDSKSISKVHITLEFNMNDNCWELIDGTKDFKSRNGTWLWINSRIEINEETLIKLGSNIISINPY